MRFSVDLLFRLNIIIVIIVLRRFYEIKRSLIFLKINEINMKVDAFQFK